MRTPVPRLDGYNPVSLRVSFLYNFFYFLRNFILAFQTTQGRVTLLQMPDLDSLMQKAVIRLVCDYHDRRTLAAKLKSLGLTTQNYRDMLDDQTFVEQLDKELQKRYKNLDKDAKLALASLVTGGDLNAIKYFHEFSGLYRPQNETVINLTLILARLMEVLVKYLPPEQLELVANEIETTVLELPRSLSETG